MVLFLPFQGKPIKDTSEAKNHSTTIVKLERDPTSWRFRREMTANISFPSAIFFHYLFNVLEQLSPVTLVAGDTMILLMNLEFLLGSVFSTEILPSVSSSFSLRDFLEHLLLKVLGFSQHFFIFCSHFLTVLKKSLY